MPDAKLYQFPAHRTLLPPSPRCSAVVGGAVCLSIGTEANGADEFLTIEQAERLGRELADAIDVARHLLRVERDAKGDDRA